MWHGRVSTKPKAQIFVHAPGRNTGGPITSETNYLGAVTRLKNGLTLCTLLPWAGTEVGCGVGPAPCRDEQGVLLGAGTRGGAQPSPAPQELLPQG